MIASKGWYQWNWNPVIGCRHSCIYCYAKPYAERRGWIKDYSQPEFNEKDLNEPKKLRKPAIIFVCAFADLFGDWVPAEWIKRVIQVIEETPQHTYVFLTKNPKRYTEFAFPPNVYLGVTVEGPDKMFRAEVLRDIPGRKFCSIEPIRGDFTGVDLSMFDWVVAGYMLYSKTTKIEKQWLKSVSHHNLYLIRR